MIIPGTVAVVSLTKYRERCPAFKRPLCSLYAALPAPPDMPKVFICTMEKLNRILSSLQAIVKIPHAGLDYKLRRYLIGTAIISPFWYTDTTQNNDFTKVSAKLLELAK